MDAEVVVADKMIYQQIAHHRPSFFNKINLLVIPLVSRACVDNKSGHKKQISQQSTEKSTQMLNYCQVKLSHRVNNKM